MPFLILLTAMADNSISDSFNLFIWQVFIKYSP